jgi:redox-sensitive bicupin YhaK (pirin superfamily)
MSNLETRPAEVACAGRERPATGTVEILEPRLVPLGGPRAMTVRRTLPQRRRSLIGGWCFADHYGPDQVAQTGGMRVPPHPHTQLQTVSWLFTGQIEHRDSAGNHAMIRPGELNLMTAGRGISHSEVSTPGTTVLHGAQLWVALPAPARFTDPGFQHYAPDAVDGLGFTARVFIGTLLGDASPVTGYSPLVGAEITIEPGQRVTVPADPAFEHGVLVDRGGLTMSGTAAVGGLSGRASEVAADRLGYLGPGETALELRAGPAGARVLLLGGEPLGEQIVMWWNFIGRSHQEVADYRAAWQAEIGAASLAAAKPGPFGLSAGDPLPPIPAPPLPNATLRPRG